ncbi:hypothetical protein RND71_004511 [Anisodus tanguticus]|uniref:Uncharacterized protein n=1 Tax=Anisodus tanguticus TaxID=243964 RepID=A0AAE1SQ38_9SOLA|nr:hypothetical protein RND71_004511 [Anisodus tanguticus]
MENFRSMSTREGGRMQKLAPTSMQDLRSYSTNSYHVPYSSMDINNNKEVKIKKSNNKSKVMSSSSKSWKLDDLELQRKRRVVGYKAYAMEGKMKGSFRKSFRWIKDTCDHVVHGWW